MPRCCHIVPVILTQENHFVCHVQKQSNTRTDKANTTKNKIFFAHMVTLFTSNEFQLR